jgi:hypothetical protein
LERTSIILKYIGVVAPFLFNPPRMNEQKALETLRTFLSMAHAENARGEMEIRNAANALNYIENWCLKSSEKGLKATIDQKK